MVNNDPQLQIANLTKVKLDATSAPTVNDDDTQGYSVGSVWIDINADKIYQCTDASTGAANWIEISAIIPMKFNRILEVNTDGNDTTGEGSIDKPFLTIARAQTEAATLSPSATNHIGIRVGPGTFIEDNSGGPLILQDYVHIVGYSASKATILKGNTNNEFLFISDTLGEGTINQVTIDGLNGIDGGGVRWVSGGNNRCQDIRFQNCKKGLFCEGSGVAGFALTIAAHNTDYPLYAYNSGIIICNGLATMSGSARAAYAMASGQILLSAFHIQGATICGVGARENGIINLVDGKIVNCLDALWFDSIPGIITADAVQIQGSTNYDVNFTNNLGTLKTLATRLDCTKINGTGTITGTSFCTAHDKNETFSEMDMKSHKITGLTNGTSAQDAMAFGQRYTDGEAESVADTRIATHASNADAHHDKAHAHDGNDGSGTVEGTDIKSTGETGGTKVLTENGSGGASWETPSANDANAIHKNVSAEISTITEKSAPVDADLLLIEDSAASNAKKRAQASNLAGKNHDIITAIEIVYVTGGSTVALGIDGTTRIFADFTRAAGTNNGSIYLCTRIAPDFKSFPSNAVAVMQRRNGTISATITMYKNGVADSTINGTNLSPGTSFAVATFTPGSTYAVGDEVLFKIDFTLDSPGEVYAFAFLDMIWNRKVG